MEYTLIRCNLHIYDAFCKSQDDARLLNVLYTCKMSFISSKSVRCKGRVRVMTTSGWVCPSMQVSLHGNIVHRLT
jgi:hypothetical protein